MIFVIALFPYILTLNGTRSSTLPQQQLTPTPSLPQSGLVTFSSEPSPAIVVYTKFPNLFPGAATTDRTYGGTYGLVYGDYEVAFYYSGYITKYVAFTLNQPQMTIATTLQPDPRWVRVANPSAASLANHFFIESEREATLARRNPTYQSPLSLGKYILNSDYLTQSDLSIPDSVKKQFTPSDTSARYTYVINPSRYQNYGFLLVVKNGQEISDYWLVDLTTLRQDQMRRIRIPNVELEFWSRDAFAFVDYSQFTEGSLDNAPLRLSLATFNSALTQFESKDLLPIIQPLLPGAFGFTPLAATNDMELLLVDGYPVPNSYERYDYFVINTLTNQARRIEVENVISAAWVDENRLWMITFFDAIYEYNWRTDTLRTITTLKDINAYGLNLFEFTPDGSYLVMQLADLSDFLIFDMANIYPPKR